MSVRLFEPELFDGVGPLVVNAVNTRLSALEEKHSVGWELIVTERFGHQVMCPSAPRAGGSLAPKAATVTTFRLPVPTSDSMIKSQRQFGPKKTLLQQVQNALPLLLESLPEIRVAMEELELKR